MARAVPHRRPAASRTAALWIVALGLLAAALTAGALLHLRAKAPAARPALWRMTLGDRQAWLFGTIHAVPRGANWSSAAVDQALRESDVLILESAGLEAERADRRVFEKLGRSPGLPAVMARIDPGARPRLTELMRRAPDTLNNLDRYEDWAAALLIEAAANQALSQDLAAEAQFERQFRAQGKPVTGLETVAQQLGVFDALPAPDQHAMLQQSIADASDAERQFALLYARWSKGDLGALEAQFLHPLRRFPHLRSALIDARNARWAQVIDQQLRTGKGRFFIAVGAGHLLGPDGVDKRLAALGWRIERMQ